MNQAKFKTSVASFLDRYISKVIVTIRHFYLIQAHIIDKFSRIFTYDHGLNRIYTFLESA